MTSFDSYSFTYEWYIIVGVGRHLNNPKPLQCPEEIKSPPGRYPATTWRLEALGTKVNRTWPDKSPDSWIVTMTLTSKDDVWVRVELGTKLRSINIHQSDKYRVRYLSVMPGCRRPRTIKLKHQSVVTGYIPFDKYSDDIDRDYLLDGNDLFIHCQIHVAQLDNLIHNTSTLVAEDLTRSPKFDLSLIMEDARHKDRYTDVTIVTSEKEFKAHKVVLASQSSFFETRLEERWTEHGGNQIEMRDVPAITMDTILTYMYTGKVVDIDKAAHELLPRADEYQLDGLKTLCEEALCKSLTAQSVIDILMMADTHNAPNLKQSCLTFIAKNISDVKKSSAWTEGKLKSEENKYCLIQILFDRGAGTHC